MAYLGYAPGRSWFANGSLVDGADDYSSSRTMAFPGFNARSSADYSGHPYTAALATGYHFHMGHGRTSSIPMGTLQYTELNLSAYTEAGSPASNLHVNAQNHYFAPSGLGGKFARDIGVSDSQLLRWERQLNWLHSFSGNTTDHTARSPATARPSSRTG